MRYIKTYNEEINFRKLLGIEKEEPKKTPISGVDPYLKKNMPPPPDPVVEKPIKPDPLKDDPEKYAEDLIAKTLGLWGRYIPGGVTQYGTRQCRDAYCKVSLEKVMPKKTDTEIFNENKVVEITVHLTGIYPKVSTYRPTVGRSANRFEPRSEARTVSVDLELEYGLEIKFERPITSTDMSTDMTFSLGKNHDYTSISGNTIRYRTLASALSRKGITLTGEIDHDASILSDRLDIKSNINKLIVLSDRAIQNEKVKEKFRVEFKPICNDLKELVGDIEELVDEYDYQVVRNELICTFKVETGFQPESVNVSNSQKTHFTVSKTKFELNKNLGNVFLLLSQLQPRVKMIDGEITTFIEFTKDVLTIKFNKPSTIFLGNA